MVFERLFFICLAQFWYILRKGTVNPFGSDIGDRTTKSNVSGILVNQGIFELLIIIEADDADESYSLLLCLMEVSLYIATPVWYDSRNPGTPLKHLKSISFEFVDFIDWLFHLIVSSWNRSLWNKIPHRLDDFNELPILYESLVSSECLCFLEIWWCRVCWGSEPQYYAFLSWNEKFSGCSIIQTYKTSFSIMVDRALTLLYMNNGTALPSSNTISVSCPPF